MENSPIPIPNNVTIIFEKKKEYIQLKYKWTDGEYEYEVRWYTKTPNSPIEGESWVAMRIIKGKGFGKNHSKRIEEIKSNNNWINKERWLETIFRKNNNKATDEDIDILNG